MVIERTAVRACDERAFAFVPYGGWPMSTDLRWERYSPFLFDGSGCGLLIAERSDNGRNLSDYLDVDSIPELSRSERLRRIGVNHELVLLHGAARTGVAAIAH
jgi:hypothetical protein